MAAEDINSVTEKLLQATVDSTNIISFAGRGIKLDGEKEAQEILDALEKNPDVRTLRLEGNTLGPQAAKAIGSALEKCPKLKITHWSDMFTGRLKTEIPEALIYLCNGMMTAKTCLTELDLSDNAFGPNGMKGLVDFLQSEACYSLKVLRLHNNGLGITGGKMLAESLLECHKLSVVAGRPLALRVFQSGRGRLENEGATALSQAFKAMGSLEEVVMPQNGIYHEGITALAEAFKSNPNLRHLNLQDNTFTAKGAIAMAAMLPLLQKLEHINFGECLVRTQGAEALAGALKNGHHNLKFLSLTYGEIKLTGALKVIRAMSGKSHLEKLDLNGNQFGEEGVVKIQTLMAGQQLENKIGTFSDDEGDEDADGEEDDVEEPEVEEGGEELDDPQLTIQGVAITPQSQQEISAVEFLQHPSATGLLQLGVTGPNKLLQHLGNEVEDVKKSVGLVMTVCGLVSVIDKTSQQAACQCTDAMLKRVLQAKEEAVAAQVGNEILVHLGLIKGEDKKFEPLQDVAGALCVLEHAVRQQYFPKMTRDILRAFIDMPNGRLDKCKSERHTLLQTLYKF